VSRESAGAVVIGAGASGLTCARALRRAGVDAVVLEARSRIGGRIHTLRVPGEPPFELGAHVVHGRDPATWDLIEAAGLVAERAQPPARFAFRVLDTTMTVADLVAYGATPPWELERRVGRRDSGDRPVCDLLAAEARSALEYDIASEWICHRWGGSPQELSASGVQRMMSASDADRRSVLVDGYDRLPAALAEGLDVRLEARATQVAWQPGSVEVRTADLQVSAQAVVVTIPPTVVAAGSIAFDPALPEDKARAAAAIDLGDALVVVAQTDAAPWSGTVLGVGPYGGLWQSRQGSGLVAGWFRGAGARRLRAEGVDAGLVRWLLDPVFPWARGSGLHDLGVADWGTDPFTLGAFSYPRAGMPELPALWASPLADTVFFAGEAACSGGKVGLVDGAVKTGGRAARAVIHALGRRRKAAGATR
jgi:monoamine oxidase